MLDLLWYLTTEDDAPSEETLAQIQFCERAGFAVINGNHLASEARRILVTRCDGIILMGSEVGTEGRDLFFTFRRSPKFIINCVGLDDAMAQIQLNQWSHDYERTVIQTVLATATHSRD